MIENTELISKFVEWAKSLSEESLAIQMARNYINERSDYRSRSLKADLNHFLVQELQKVGFDQDASTFLIPDLSGRLAYWQKEDPIEIFQDLINGSSAKYKRAENTVPAKEYWEKFFSENPDLKPKHIVYYDGDPTNAIYRFQQENGIGSADTSKTEGQLLGFDDHHVIDVANDPRSNRGHQELVDLGNKIIKEHFAFK